MTDLSPACTTAEGETSYAHAATWSRAYADELELAGWTEDAEHFRRVARQLDIGPPRATAFVDRMDAARFLVRHGRSWLDLTDEDVERGARAIDTDPTYRNEIARDALAHAAEVGPPSLKKRVIAAKALLEFR